jgi:hypothetical protein
MSPDTSYEAEIVWFDALRAAGDVARLRRVGSLGREIEAVVHAQIRVDHPGATEREVRLLAAAREFPRETMIAVWGFDPALHGIRC